MAGEPASAPPPLVRDGNFVAVKTADGAVQYVHHNDLQGAISEGARPATETEWQDAKLGTSGEVAAGAIGVGQGLSFGYAAPVAVGAAQALGADETAEQIKRGLKIAKQTSPNAYLTGEVAGALLPMAFGAPPAAAGEEITGSVLARAGQRALQAAPRAGLEGGAIGVGNQWTEDTIDNHPFAASAYLQSAITGGTLGVILGGAGAAGVGAAADKAALIFGGRAPEGVGAAEKVLARERRVAIDPDAGLFEKAEKIEKPFVFGPKGHSVRLDTAALDNEFASGVRGVDAIAPGGTAERTRGFADAAPRRLVGEGDNAALLDAHEVPFESTPFLRAGKVARIRGDEDMLFGEATAPVFNRGSTAFEKGFVPEVERAPINLRTGHEPSFRAPNDAGALSTAEDASNVFNISRAKNAKRTVGLGDVEQDGLIGSRPGLHIEEPALAADAAGPKTFAQKVDDLASKQAFAATGAKMPDIRLLGPDAAAQEEAMVRIGGRLRDLSIDGKPLIEATASHADVANRITAKTAEVAKSIRPMYEELDRAVSRPSLDTIASRFDAEVRRPLAKSLYGDVELRDAEDALVRLAKKGGDQPSFVQLWENRMQIDKQLRRAYVRPYGTPVPPGEESLRALRGIVNDELLKSADRASNELGGTIGQKLRLTNELYADLRTAKTIVSKESARNSGTNKVSITDVIAASHGGPAGFAGGAMNMVRRLYGNQIASHVLGESARLMGVQRAVTQMDGAISRGAREFVEGKGPSIAPRAAKLATVEEIRSLRDAVRTPEAITAKIQAALGDLPKYAPKIAASVATRVATSAAFLRDNLPKEPPPVGLSWTRTERPLSDTQRLTASQMIETVEDPTIVLDRLLEGRLTRTHVETLKATDPAAYAKTVQYINEHGTELRAKLSMQQQAALCLLFGEPINEAFLPANIKAFQASLVGGSQAPGKGGMGGNEGAAAMGRPIGLKNPGGSVATANDKIEKGET